MLCVRCIVAVVSNNAELRHVIQHPVGIKYFTEALKKEFSQENIDVRPFRFCCALLLPRRHQLLLLCTRALTMHHVMASMPTWGCLLSLSVLCTVQFWDRANTFRQKYQHTDGKPFSPSMEMLKVWRLLTPPPARPLPSGVCCTAGVVCIIVL